MSVSRRTLLLGATAAVSLAGASLKLRAAAETDMRFVFIFLRGAMDGLSVVVPYRDSALKTLRPKLMLPEPGQPGGLTDLDGSWGLHPALQTMLALYRDGALLPIQCVAGPDRSRSHFQSQDLLEVGATDRLSSGWMNRLAALLPDNPNCDMALAMGTLPPLILQGAKNSTTWDPFHQRPRVSPEFYENIVSMHAGDPLTAVRLANGLRARHYIDGALQGLSYNGISNGFPRLAAAAARLLAAPDGPRIAELELDGWDTHSNQQVRLSESLRRLDEGIALLRAGLSAVWDQTVIVVATEFGRTVAANGTGGTDHGTATASFVLGGKIAGRRVLVDWPGLADHQLFEERDLSPTLDIRSILKGVLMPHFHISTKAAETIFPDSASIAPKEGLWA